MLKQEGYSLSGWKGVAAGNVPIGAGLSSSAAFELAIARAFTSVGNWEWQPLEMAGFCQRAENEWVGMNCGIMDQTISALGQAGNALFLDCRSLETLQVRMPDNLQIAVMDTGTRHELVDSAYNERRLQCEKAGSFFEVKIGTWGVCLAFACGLSCNARPPCSRSAGSIDTYIHIYTRNMCWPKPSFQMSSPRS